MAMVFENRNVVGRRVDGGWARGERADEEEAAGGEIAGLRGRFGSGLIARARA
jgi:hypothetical protein